MSSRIVIMICNWKENDKKRTTNCDSTLLNMPTLSIRSYAALSTFERLARGDVIALRLLSLQIIDDERRW